MADPAAVSEFFVVVAKMFRFFFSLWEKAESWRGFVPPTVVLLVPLLRCSSLL